ncbi:nuclear receptor-binding protein-like [Lineus longissimus]|uniref:nuclear receptor-binding protein-like n=1 Tax=Lineus longissimus TaxID=88925 RepID=UPI002B4F9B1B
MAGSKSSDNQEPEAPPEDSGDESTDEESEILEESPCGRWQKRREEIEQRDIPGIDNAFLAMDTEEGVEVVWNEVQFSEKRNFKAQQEKIKHVFDNLIELDHPNIVKFHKYWTDTKGEKPRVIFITEYMSSGSLKNFIKKTKKNNKTLKAWKRWTTQILSALSYLHSCDPPIIHGNLSCDTIFIQHNGLIKIGSVAPDAIHNHVKTCREEAKNMYYIAPEYAEPSRVTTAVDMYSFGICALEMATLHILGNGDSGQKYVPKEAIMKALDSLDDKLQQDFMRQCLNEDPVLRPRAREMLFHTVLFEVHSLKVLAAHCFVKDANNIPDNVTGENKSSSRVDPKTVIASIPHTDGRGTIDWRVSQVPIVEIEKLLEDVRNGIYPLTAFASIDQPPPTRPGAVSPEIAESVKSETPEPVDTETRVVIQMFAAIEKIEESTSLQLTLMLRMDDKMNRQLRCEMGDDESSETLADELVHHGFICYNDRDRILAVIDEAKSKRSQTDAPVTVQTTIQNV